MAWEQRVIDVPKTVVEIWPDNDTWFSIKSAASGEGRWHYFSIAAGFFGDGDDATCKRNLIEFVERTLTEKLELIRRLKAEVAE